MKKIIVFLFVFASLVTLLSSCGDISDGFDAFIDGGIIGAIQNSQRCKHEHTYQQTVYEPGCEHHGYYYERCGTYGCDEILGEGELPALGHDFSNPYISNDLYHWKTCNRCEVAEGGEAHTPDESGIQCTVCLRYMDHSSSIQYTYSDDKSYVIITGYTGHDQELVLPTTINGIPVKAIKSSAFRKNYTITSLVIPEGITEIGSYAFYDCTCIFKVTLPSSIKTIGTGAFDKCNNLQYVYIDSIYSWMNISFADYNSNPLCYGAYLYTNNEPFSEFISDENITSIGDYAFYNCKSLTKVVLNEDIKSIGKEAFRECSVTELEVYCDASLIERSTFLFVYPPTITATNDSINVIYSDDRFDRIENLTLLDGEQFHWGRFKSLKSLTLPSSITKMVGPQYTSSYHLSDLYIEDLSAWLNIEFESANDNPLRMDNITLYFGGKPVTEVILPEGMTEIKPYTFYNLKQLEKVVILDSVTAIGEYAFFRCENLKKLTLGKNLEVIGKSAFYGCKSLTELNLGDKITDIGYSAFGYCEGITSLVIDSEVKIGEYAFDHCNISELEIGDKVISLEKDSFSGCPIKILKTPVRLMSKLYCREKLTLTGEGYIYSSMISTDLTDLTIVDGNIRFDGDAFKECRNLTNVYVTDMSCWLSCYFYSRLSNPRFVAKNFYLGGELISDSIVIPDDVKKISPYAFSGFYLEEITIGESVEYIGADAFLYCSGLKNVNIKNIDNWCKIYFANEYSTPMQYAENIYLNGEEFDYVKIPDGIEHISYLTFYNFSNLRVVEIPEGVKSIYSTAFQGCKNIEAIIFNQTTPKIEYNAFSFASVDAIYFKGPRENWDTSKIKSKYPNMGNNTLLEAQVYFYSELTPSDEGNYWHYDENGKIVIW